MIGEIDPSQGGLSKRGKRCGSMKAGFVYFALVFALMPWMYTVFERDPGTPA
jgi:hypothetical protein